MNQSIASNIENKNKQNHLPMSKEQITYDGFSLNQRRVCKEFMTHSNLSFEAAVLQVLSEENECKIFL